MALPTMKRSNEIYEDTQEELEMQRKKVKKGMQDVPDPFGFFD